jgi:hypothetical protein
VKAHRAKSAARTEAAQAALTVRAETAEAEAAWLRERLAAAEATLATSAGAMPTAAAVTCMWCADTGRPGFLPDLDDENVWYPCDHDDPAVVAENARVRELEERWSAPPVVPEPVPVSALPKKKRDPMPTAPPEAVLPTVVEEGQDRWRVELDGEAVGTVQRHRRSREVVLGRREEYVEWSGHTAGGREVWSGGPPRDLDDAVGMVSWDARAWMRARWRREQPVRMGKPRRNGSRLVKQGTEIGEVRRDGRGWYAVIGSGSLLRQVAGPDEQTLYLATDREAAAVLAAYSWQAADDFWRGKDPLLKPTAVLREQGTREAPTGAR